MTPEVWASLFIGTIVGIVVGLMIDDWLFYRRTRKHE